MCSAGGSVGGRRWPLGRSCALQHGSLGDLHQICHLALGLLAFVVLCLVSTSPGRVWYLDLCWFPKNFPRFVLCLCRITRFKFCCGFFGDSQERKKSQLGIQTRTLSRQETSSLGLLRGRRFRILDSKVFGHPHRNLPKTLNDYVVHFPNPPQAKPFAPCWVGQISYFAKAACAIGSAQEGATSMLQARQPDVSSFDTLILRWSKLQYKPSISWAATSTKYIGNNLGGLSTAFPHFFTNGV